jgi:hypothetical protein
MAAFGLLACRWRRTGALIQRGAAAPPDIDALTGDLAAALALRRVPRVLMSVEVDTPLVSGFVRPVVLLPARFTDLARRQQRLAICHELLHIARGDLWLGWVPALAERVFFFHPLVHLAAREYVFWREAACDAAVLEKLHAEPREYGRLLLDLGISAPRRSLAAAGASWSFSNLKRRIRMLGHLSRASRSRASRFVAVTTVLLALGAWVPLRLVARPSAPDIQAPSASAQQPQPPASPQAPAAPARPASAGQRSVPSDAGEINYVLLISADGERVHMSGSRSDVERARSFRRGQESLLWFRNEDGEFVVRDAAILQQVENAWKPVGELGAKQGQLGAQQGQLGAKQGQLGAEQAKLGAEQAALGARQAAIGAKQAQLGAEEWNPSEARRAEIDKKHQGLEKEMRALDEEMRALDARMRELEKPMRELGGQMEGLGAQMEELGREMERASERAQAEMRALFERAVASGKAERVR